MFKLEARIVNTEKQETVTGVSSPITSLDQIKNPQDLMLILTALTASAQLALSSTPDLPKTGDKDGAFQLRRYAELLESGKYVVTVHTRHLSPESTEIRLLLDSRKS